VGIVLDHIPGSATGERNPARISDLSVRRKDGVVASMLRIFPSFLDLAFLAPFGFLLARPTGFKSLLGDGDTGWHLQTGEWILQNRNVPYNDFFSFSRPGGPWFAWEWLWDACFAWLQRIGGLAAVLLVSTLIICTASAVVYGITRKKSGNSVVALILSLLVVCATSFHWLARPHLFTFLFAALFFAVLDAGPARKRLMMIVLPCLMIVWTNLHGGFIVGLLMVLCYAAGEGIRFLISTGGERDSARSNALIYAEVLGLCGAATFFNPYFFRLHQHLIGYLTDGYALRYISEFQSISFHHPLALFFEVLLIAGIATAFWNLMNKRVVPALLLLGFAHLALMSGRNIPIFAIIAAPLIAEGITAFLAWLRTAESKWVRHATSRFRGFCTEMDVMESIPRLHIVSAGLVWLIGSIVYAPAPPARFLAEYDANTFPARAIDKIQKEDLGTRIFSTDDWSGYLIYRMYPKVKVFIDGRSDYYGPKFGEEYADVLNVKYDWEARLRKYDVRTILLPANSFLSAALKETHRWRCVYDDGVAIVFRSAASGEQVSAALSGGRKARDLR
jgi:hypothetical protein